MQRQNSHSPSKDASKSISTQSPYSPQSRSCDQRLNSPIPPLVLPPPPYPGRRAYATIDSTRSSPTSASNGKRTEAPPVGVTQAEKEAAPIVTIQSPASATASSVNAAQASTSDLRRCLSRPHMNGLPINFESNLRLVFDGYSLVKVLRDSEVGSSFQALGPDGNSYVVKMLPIRPPVTTASAGWLAPLVAFTASQDATDAFERLERLSHPALAQVHHAALRRRDGSCDTLVVCREYMRRDSLVQIRRISPTRVECETLSETNWCTTVSALLSALTYLHANDVSHGRLKPSNVLSDGHGHVFLTDYGLLLPRAVMDAEPRDSMLFSDTDLLFQSPQVLSGMPFDPAANDMWGVGVMIFMAFAGYAPFANPQETMAATEPPHLPASVFRNLEFGDWHACLISKLLTVKESERWTARNALEMLVKARSHEDPSGLRFQTLELSRSQSQRSGKDTFKSVETTESCSVPSVLHLGSAPHNGRHSDAQTQRPKLSGTFSRAGSFDASLLNDADAPADVIKSVNALATPSLLTPTALPPALQFESAASGGQLDSAASCASPSGSGAESPSAFPSAPSCGHPLSYGSFRIGTTRSYLIEAAGPTALMTSVPASAPVPARFPHPPRTASASSMADPNKVSPAAATPSHDSKTTTLSVLPTIGIDMSFPRLSQPGPSTTTQSRPQRSPPYAACTPLSSQHINVSDAEPGQSLLAFSETIGTGSVNKSADAARQRSVFPSQSITIAPYSEHPSPYVIPSLPLSKPTSPQSSGQSPLAGERGTALMPSIRVSSSAVIRNKKAASGAPQPTNLSYY